MQKEKILTEQEVVNKYLTNEKIASDCGRDPDDIEFFDHCRKDFFYLARQAGGKFIEAEGELSYVCDVERLVNVLVAPSLYDTLGED